MLQSVVFTFRALVLLNLLLPHFLRKTFYSSSQPKLSEEEEEEEEEEERSELSSTFTLKILLCKFKIIYIKSVWCTVQCKGDFGTAVLVPLLHKVTHTLLSY